MAKEKDGARRLFSGLLPLLCDHQREEDIGLGLGDLPVDRSERADEVQERYTGRLPVPWTEFGEIAAFGGNAGIDSTRSRKVRSLTRQNEWLYHSFCPCFIPC